MTERWLVIDDSSTIQRVIKLAFQDYDLQIMEADSCMDGTRELSRLSPSLVIVDASVAGAQGVQDFVALRNLAPQTPFVILQGSYDAIGEVAFVQAGFKHFLRKPFDGAQLLHVTRLALGRALPPRVGEESLIPPPPPPPMPASSELPRPSREEKTVLAGSERNFDPAGSPRDSLARSSAFTMSLEEELPNAALEAFAQGRREQLSRGFVGGASSLIDPMMREELEKAVRQVVEEYCRKNFAGLAREMIGKELEKLTQERSRLLVDK